MIRFLCFFIPILFLGACKPSSSTTTSIPAPTTPTATSKSLKINKTKPSCPISGEILTHNQLWLPNHSLIACISSDSTTEDATFGNSHRIISLYNTNNCEEALRLVLPINRSPDFPYYLADRNYNNDSDIIAIKGIDHFYCLDLNKKRLLPPLRPTFRTPRPKVDAQSNQIQKLEIWENYIIGYAQDQGVFVFQINTPNNPSPVLPHVEYKVNENLYHSLFLLPLEDKVQAIIPTFDWEEDRFEINPLFKEPIALEKKAPSEKINNPYVVLRDMDAKLGIAIDLKIRKKIDLPATIQQQRSEDIEAYLGNR